MKRLVRDLVPRAAAAVAGALALVLVGGTGAWAAVAAAPGGPTAPGGPAAPGGPERSTVQGQAVQAVAGFLGDAGLQSVATSGPVVTSTVATASGPVTVLQWTLVASDASGPVVLSLSWLGGTQLVVTETRPVDGFSGETLVLVPGSSSIQGTYQVGRSAASAAASHRVAPGAVAVAAHFAVLHPRGNHQRAQLVTYLGCYPAPQNPTVIGSVYGPLIQGEGIVDCSTPRSLGIIAGIYKGYARVGTASGSGYGYYYSLNAYAPCYASGGNYFVTTELWSVNGAQQPGTQSGWSYLDCA